MKTVIITMVAALAFGGYYSSNYTRKDCTVIQYYDNCATFEDRTGHRWDAYIDDGIEVGQKYDLKMHTNYTPDDCEDDIIKGVVR